MNRLLTLVVVCMLAPCALAASAAAQTSARVVDFELTVVGPDGKPIPEAQAEFRTPSVLVGESIKRGELVRKHDYGVIVKSDASGQMTVALAGRITLFISQPGFAPYWGEWDSPPAEPFTAELDLAWSVGGLVVDDQGALVEGAEVHPSIQFKNRPGQSGEMYSGARVKTDANGAWRFESVPEAMANVSVEIHHEKFMPMRHDLARGIYELKTGATPSARIELSRGLTLSGVVTDEGGRPIAGASVRTKFINDLRTATTDAAGRYELIGCSKGKARVVVSAAGRALELKEVQVTADMPLDFTLSPGNTLRVRVVDATGKPVPKARVFFQSWRGRIDYFEFDHLESYTNDEGLWIWNEAPADAMEADIAPPEGMQLSQQRLTAGDEEHVFTILPPLTVLGAVTDAVTGAPIKEFLLIPGIQFGTPQEHWLRERAVEGRDGIFQYVSDLDDRDVVLRIEARDHRPAESRIIKSSEGTARVDFALEPAEGIEAILLTPAGEPAVGAMAVINPPDRYVSVRDGLINGGTVAAAQATADAKGRVGFLAQDGPFVLLMTHAEGFANVKSNNGTIPAEIRLEPWARIEGTFRVGAKAMPGVTLTLEVQLDDPANLVESPKLRPSYETTTDADGHFVFERMFPGKGRVGRRLLRMVDEGATEVTSSRREPFVTVSGETLQLDLGNSGRPVVGKLLAPKGVGEKVQWSFASISMDLPNLLPPLLDAADPQTAMKQMAWRAAMQQRSFAAPLFWASADEAGAFRIDDVPPGVYRLRVDFYEQPGGRLQDFSVTVPPLDGEQSDEPVDVGEVQLLP